MVEASSESTAVSQAYFAALLGLPFVAVMPASTSPSKSALIESQGGRCHFVDHPGEVYAEATRIAEATGGHYLDQFTNAERATDWRGNNNIAESIFEQMRDEPHPIPAWVVVGAGPGGTSATSDATSATAAAKPSCAWSYYNDDRLRAHDLDPNQHAGALVEFERSCGWS